MSPIKHTPLSTFLDSLSGKWLILAALVVTFAFGGAYYFISQGAPADGLIDSDDQTISFADSIYFSVVTEATLGYGDIRPVGWSRLLACCQVLSGLVLAGLAVATITSLPGRELRSLAKLVCGDWIEVCLLPGGHVMVTFSRIYIGGEMIHYDGENFHRDGNPWGFFKGDLIDFEGTHLRFRYSNRESLTVEFVEGICNISFIPNTDGIWIRSAGSAHDFGKMQTFSYEGFRAATEEAAIVNGTDFVARRALIAKYASRIAPSIDDK